MHVYPIYLTFMEEGGDSGIQKGPTVGDVIAIRFTWRGMKRKFRKLDWKKEITNHLIFIDDRDMYEAVDVEIEELKNTVFDEGYIPSIDARVKYSVRDKKTSSIVLKRNVYLIITPILDAKI